MIRLIVQRTALMLGAGLGLLGTRPATANAQKALVYCPVGIDATGCNAIVNALTGPTYPLGVDRGYDGTGGTVDLKTVDLFTYSVFVVPSLADGSTSQPYALLRDPEVAEHLRAALIGRLAMWSGSPDQGATNRAMKDALIQNLAGWAGAAFGTAKGPGLVALLDASASATSRYDWVRAITPVPVTSDAALLIYSAVRALDARATSILTSGAGPIAYDNMATFGFQLPNGAPGVSLDAVGQTGTTQGGQVVLITMEAGNSSGALVRTDKDDYAPHQTVTITGTGWQANETVKLTLHMDPLRDSDTELTATADATGAFVNTDFAPGDYDIGVRFVLTALGTTSGRRAQATFTDGNKVTFSTTAAGDPETTNFGTVAQNQCVSAFVQERQGSNIDNGSHPARAVTLSSTPSGATFFGAAACAGAPITSVTIPADTPAIAFWFSIATNGNYTINGAGAGLTGSNNASAIITVSGVAAPTATNDSYSTNEDQPLTVAAPGVLGNDVGAGPLTAVLVTSPPVSEGTVSLSANGGFTFNPAADFNGTTSFTYRAQNSGGLSAPATVTITVNSVNDAPTFTLIASHSSNEDAGLQTVANAVTAKSAGPANESSQTLLPLVVTNNNNALFSSQPAIDGSGTLTYTAAANANGSATVSVKLQDNGGTANGGVDATTKTFTITVTAVNDAPSFVKGADQTVNEDAGAQTVSGWATAISAGPADEAGQTLTFVITSNSNTALFSAGPAVAPNGTLTYTPAPNANGTATIKLKLTDNGGTLNGGVDASAEQTFIITVNAVNDAPSFVKGANQTVLEDASAQTVAGWATSIVAGPTDEAGQSVTFGATNDNNALFTVQPSIAPNGTLTYTPAANAYGSATVTVTLSDNGGTANGGIDTSAPQTFTITLTPVNDAPSFTKGADQNVNEDAGAQTVSNWATAISAGPNETQVLTFQVSSNNATLFSAGPSISSTGTLTYTPAPNANGSATVTVFLKDDGGTANGGVDASASQTFTITVGAVNDAPSFTKGADQTVNEDAPAQTVAGWATAISAGPADEETQTVDFIVTNDNNAMFSVQPAIAANGTLTYTAAPNAFGSATVTVKLHDDGGTLNGGVDTSAPQTFTITINSVNDAPSFVKGADQTVNEDGGAQSVSGWATAISGGPANESSQTVSFEITANTNPALFSSGPAVAPNGTLTYTPAANANGIATITLRIHDNGGTANGGVDVSTTQSFVINVTAVNDAPTFIKGANQTVLEDAGAQIVNAWATAISAGPVDESAQTLTFTTTNDNNTLFSVQPSVATDGTLTYTPAANAYGSAIVTVKLTDNGGTANGGVDESQQTFTITVTPVNDAPSFTKGADQTVNEDAGLQTVAGWATAISAGPNEASQAVNFVVSNDNNSLFSVQPAVAANGTLTYTPAANAFGTATVTLRIHDDGGTANGGIDTSGDQTFIVTVNSVNDAPSFTKGADQTVLEDAGPQTVNGWATAISAGPSNESGQAVDFLVTNDNNTLFSVQPTIAPNGSLTYTAAADAFGSATVTVKIHDDGGTANGGVDTSAPQTFTITITPVNDAPSFTKGPDQNVLEDAAPVSVSWATAISAGPANESGQAVDFVVTANTNPTLFAVAPAVAPNGTLTYTLAANANGMATITLKIHDDGGTANGGVDESATQTFVINVTAVNDAPSFTKGADQTVLEDAGAQTVAGWATAISAGPADEASQTLTFATSNDNNSLFSVQPSVATDGTLTYTPAPNAYGLATITVTLKDNGGTTGGGVDTSAPQTFTITVTPVNDEPSFTKGANQTVNEDAVAQTVTGWATAISAGPNEPTQVVNFIVTNDNNGLFSAQPAVAANGTLTYTPAANAFGSAIVTVIIHDDGGTANGGDDTSDSQTFTITVNSVNDAPTFVKGADQSILEDAGAQTVAGWATAVSAGPANESSQTLTFSTTNTNSALFAVAPAIDPATGTLTYTPAVNANGTATVTVTLKDNGGTANGGVDESQQTFVITITAVNDVPSFVKGADQTVLEDAGPQSVSGWATAISAGPADESGQTLTFLVTGNSNSSLFLAQPVIDASGKLTYTPAANANGSATITIALKDNGGTANGGVDTSPTQTFVINVTAVNDAPSFTKGADQTVNEDAPAQTIAGWATGLSAGPADESGQALNFIVTNDNNTIFAVQPSVSATGELTYSPAPNAFGTATVTVKIHDDGGTLNGGVDTSAPQTFTITINAVNDAPAFTKGADQSVNEDAGAQTVAGWATGISAGPANESSQTVSFEITGNTNAALFSSGPSVAANGTLTYTPAANANGTATITLRIHDDGGTANGGVDVSTTQSFVITVTAVNDAPTYNLIASHTSAEDAVAQSVVALTAALPGPPNESVQTLSISSISNNNNALFSAQPTIDLSTGVLTYTAAANANGTATVTVTVKDNGGTANGGVDATTKTMTITITPVNDVPVINSFGSPLLPNAVNALVTATGSFTDNDLADSPPDVVTAKINWGDGSTPTTATISGTGTTRSVNGSHTYATAGVYTLTLTVTDVALATDTEIYQYVVVYDPNGGFVTGGGWIDSPVGACKLAPCTAQTVGKANFGFVSKYKKGQSTPDGNTEFQFKAGDINFHSEIYEWLVVSGAKAQFKGTGTINGSGNYGFLLSAVDGQISGGGGADKFRIKIWDKNNGDAVVYDNQMLAADDATPTTLLGGGSINIQAK